jgi:hypothetical protein
MHRVRGLLVLALLLIPGVAYSLQLHWSSGADTLTFTEATRAILVLRADSAEVTLPPEWRLLWVGDSTEVEVVELDSLEVCEGDTAQVYGVDGPSTPVDSTAHLVTARFCSGGSGSAEQAVFQLDLPAWGRGKCKVVALDPTDSISVLESNEVTFNGGVADEFAPALLAASSTHESCTLEVTAIGAGLGSITSMRLAAPDTLWSVPLAITAQVGSAITAVADVPMDLPASVVEAAGAVGAAASAALPADQIMALASGLPDTVLFRDPDWTSTLATTVYPKDFAFFYNNVPLSGGGWKGLFHLIYIRHNNNYDPRYHSGFTSDQPESLLAHAWSENLRDWHVDKRAFSPNYGNSSAWDYLHVWAPSLVQVGSQVYMFYAGVDANHDQRIGYVTTSQLGTDDTQWSAARTEVYAAANTGWADPEGNTPDVLGQQQFRDPWVMADPDHPGKYLLFNIGEDRDTLYNGTGATVVGVARNAGSTLNSWADLGRYRCTDYGHTGFTFAESPLVMRDSTSGAPWRIFIANGGYDDAGDNSTFFVSESLSVALSDTTLGQWYGLTNLYTYLGDNQSLIGWQACEHVQVGPFHFFAGFNGDGIAITRTRWDAQSQTFKIGDPLTAVSPGGGAGDPRFCLVDFRPGVRVIRFALETSQLIAPHLIVYDIAGRKVRTLLDGPAFVGRREVQWDCRDVAGALVPPGVFFARLTGAGRQQVRRVVVIR